MKKVALVLGSGGARGLAHIGVIEELEHQGFEITSVAGSSMGAVVGGIYAAGHLPEYKDWICKLDRMGVFSLMDFTLTNRGFIKAEKVFNELKKFVGNQKIEDLKIPFATVATDITGGRQLYFNDGELFHAIRASIAIPSVVTPVFVNEKVLVDGGVMNPLPMDIVKRTSGDILVAVDINAQGQYKLKKADEKSDSAQNEKEESKWIASISKIIKGYTTSDKVKKPNYFEILNSSMDLMQNQLTEIMIKEHKPDVLINIPRSAANTFDFFKAEELIAFGRQETRTALEKLK